MGPLSASPGGASPFKQLEGAKQNGNILQATVSHEEEKGRSQTLHAWFLSQIHQRWVTVPSLGKSEEVERDPGYKSNEAAWKETEIGNKFLPNIYPFFDILAIWVPWLMWWWHKVWLSRSWRRDQKSLWAILHLYEATAHANFSC